MNSVPSAPSPSNAVSLAALLSLAWPIILARATQAVIGFTDALLIAPLGEEALAAVTTGSMNTFAFIILPMGTVFILQSFTAQLRGRGELQAVRRYGVYGLVLALLSGIVAAALIPWIGSMLGLLSLAPGVRDAMTTYLSIRLLSVAPAVGAEALGNWYGGLGNTRLGMIASVVSMVSNFAAAWLLIQPHFGLPGYGVEGAAWASVFATWLGFFVLLYCYWTGKGYELPNAPLQIVRRELYRVVRFGLPNGVNWFLEFAAFALFINVAVGHYGTSVLAAFNVTMQINSISFMPAFGLASAGAILVGEAIGSKRLDRVWPIVKRTGLTACVWMVSVGLSYLIAPEVLLRWFVSEQASADSIVEPGVTMLAIAALWQLFDSLIMTLSEALRAAGDTTWCMVARIALAWGVFAPLAWWVVFVRNGSIEMMMGTLVTYVVLLALLLSARFASGRWRNIELIASREPSVA